MEELTIVLRAKTRRVVNGFNTSGKLQLRFPIAGGIDGSWNWYIYGYVPTSTVVTIDAPSLFHRGEVPQHGYLASGV